MRRLLLVDDADGRLAALACGIALLEGAPGYDEVIPCAASPSPDPVVAGVLDEVGLKVAPLIRDFSTVNPTPDDTVISLGQRPTDGSAVHWSFALPPRDAHPLVQRSAARITRDALGRKLAALG